MAITISGDTGVSGVAGTVSTPTFVGTDTDTGVYYSAANTLDFATGGTAAAQLDSSQNLKFNSGYGSVATAYGCRAWVNFNGTGTVAIRASGNVTSITDVNTGQYTINFTNAMPDANYSAVVGIARSYAGFDTADSNRILTVVSASTSSVSVQTTTPPTTLADLAYIGVAIFR